MMCSTRVLALLAMLVGLAESFSWNIVRVERTRLEFLYDGLLTHTEDIPSASYITSVTYDPIHNRVLFADYSNDILKVFSFDILTRHIQSLITKTFNYMGFYVIRVFYDPITQLLFWREGTDIYTTSLNPESSTEANGNLLVTLDYIYNDFAVDSCEGFIYWATDYEIGRTQLDGSGTEILIHSIVYDRQSLAIDLQTQKLYWTEKTLVNGGYQWSIKSANFYGKNRTTLFIISESKHRPSSLTVSKDFLYWEVYNQGIWQLPKNSLELVARKLYSIPDTSYELCQHIAAKYTINGLIEGIKTCKNEQYLVTNNLNPENTVSSSDFSVICQNYCLQGDCVVSAGGQPECSCKPGYSGERCEANVCHKHCLNGGVCFLNEEDEPVCQCTTDYEGERCEVTACKDYCVGAEEETRFRCNASNSGDSKIDPCHQYCLNNGVCSLNQESEPICQCTADYEGARCDVPTFVTKWFLYAYKNTRISPETLSKAVNSTSASTVA